MKLLGSNEVPAECNDSATVPKQDPRGIQPLAGTMQHTLPLHTLPLHTLPNGLCGNFLGVRFLNIRVAIVSLFPCVILHNLRYDPRAAWVD